MFLFAIILITEIVLKLNLENEEVIIDTKKTIRDINKFMQRIFLFCFCLLLCLDLPVHSYWGKFGISLNYPGVGFKYIYRTKNIFELRLQYLPTEESDTTLFGLRYYRIYPLIKNRVLFYYFGVEGAYFKYSERYLSTDFYTVNGWLLGVYLGLEKFFLKNFSINFDLGPYTATAMISNYSKNEFEFVLNASVNYYWGK